MTNFSFTVVVTVLPLPVQYISLTLNVFYRALVMVPHISVMPKLERMN